MEQFDIPEATRLAKKYAKPAIQQQAMQRQMQQLQQMLSMGGGRQPSQGMPTMGRGGPEEATPQTIMKETAGASYG